MDFYDRIICRGRNSVKLTPSDYHIYGICSKRFALKLNAFHKHQSALRHMCLFLHLRLKRGLISADNIR